MTKHLVVARFNEDISWLKSINSVDKIFLYNKGGEIDMESISLPNVGREAHSYIYHIVNNYDNLADMTIFLQGNPFDHTLGVTPLNINQKINDFILNEDGKFPFYNKGMGGCDDTLNTVLYSELFEGVCNYCHFSPGAQWVVSRENIRSKSFEFYTKCWEELKISKVVLWEDQFGPGLRGPRLENLYNGWSFESMWYYLFDKNIKEKNKFLI